MNSSATVAKTKAIRVVLACAVFCATTLCSAQETTRGIIAEKISTAKNSTERAEPELLFPKDIPYYDECISVSSDLKFIVIADSIESYNGINFFKKYYIVDFATGYVLRIISLPHKDIGTVGISEDNNYIKISYHNEVYIFSVETGQQVSDVNQNFIYFRKIDKESETLPFTDDDELYEISKSKHLDEWLYNEKNLYICEHFGDAELFVFDANTKRKYNFRGIVGNRNTSCHHYIYEDKSLEPQSVATAYIDGHIVRYSMQGEVLNIYDFDSNDYIQKIEQQNELLIAYGNENIYVYDLYSGKLLRQCIDDINYFFYDPGASELYYNFEENYNIQITIIGDSISKTYDLNGKFNLETGDRISFPFDTDCPVFDYEDFVNLNNTIYFLTTDDNLETIIKKWNHLDNTVEDIKTGLFFSNVSSFKHVNFSYRFYYNNEKNNTLYVTLLENEQKIYCILKCDLTTSKCSIYYPENEYRYANLLFTDDSETVVFTSMDFTSNSVLDLKDFSFIKSLNFSEEKIKDFKVYKDGLLSFFNEKNTVLLYDNRGNFISKYSNYEEYRKSRDYRFQRFLGYNGLTVSDFYGELYHVQFVQNGESLIYTPEGFFCGSEWATQNLVYIVDGMDVIGIDQVYDTYYRPDLVAAKMRGEDISAYASSVRLASLVRSGRAPVVSLLDIPAESSGRDMTFDISVRNTGGGIGAVNLLLNGKAIRLSDGVTAADGDTISFRHTVTLQNGNNTLEAFALNGAGLVESVRSSAQVVWRGATEKPDLYVLTAAVNRYRDKSLWLNYAVPDAQSVAAGFQKQKSGLYRNVHISQLNDGEVTKEKLAAEFSRLSEHIRADDVFVFFVSGHGTTYDDGDYYYLPSDFRYTSKDSIPNGGISKNDLLANLSKIKAGKTLVMLDTCNSGAFLSDSNKRGLSEKTAIDRLTRATGHATLAASSDTQSAMEGYNGHGVFTYVFLEGIAGAADSDGDGYVTLNELSTFVEREVPERSYEKWGYEQVPQKDLRRQDFPIAGK